MPIEIAGVGSGKAFATSVISGAGTFLRAVLTTGAVATGAYILGFGNSTTGVGVGFGASFTTSRLIGAAFTGCTGCGSTPRSAAPQSEWSNTSAQC